VNCCFTMQSNTNNVTGQLQTIYIDMKNMFQTDFEFASSVGYRMQITG